MSFNRGHMFLITGFQSGFGQYCYEQLPSQGYARNSAWDDARNLANNQPDLYIIHAAASARKNINTDLYSFVEDNILLTYQLTQLPCKKFIYLSSADVYPENENMHQETELIEIDQTKNWYAKSKLISESIITKNCPNHLILRCTSLLGSNMRPNNLTRLLFEDHPSLSLSPTSSLNCLLYEDVLHFINTAITNDLTGTYNLAAAKNACLQEIADAFAKSANFGSFNYQVGLIDHSKASAVAAQFNETSLEKIHTFYTHSLLK